MVSEVDYHHITFAMYNSEDQRVLCRVSRLALTEQAQQAGVADADDIRETFDRCRAKIEALASGKYDSGDPLPKIVNSDF